MKLAMGNGMMSVGGLIPKVARTQLRSEMNLVTRLGDSLKPMVACTRVDGFMLAMANGIMGMSESEGRRGSGAEGVGIEMGIENWA